MKIKYLFLVLVIAALALAGTGCNNVTNKVTGGGWFTNDWSQSQNKITFGFNAQLSPDDGVVKGQFQLIDHSNNPPTRVHGIFNGTAIGGIEGTCTIDGEGPHYLIMSCMDSGEPGPDAGDFINIWIDGAPMYSGSLEGGNIQFHPVEPE